jgi:polar amino acid transport system substrate-binding protein
MFNFKKRGTLLLVVMTMVAMFMVGCSSDAPAGDSELKPVVMGLDDTFAPMGFRDEKGELVGFDIDLAREVATREGWDITFQPIDWSMKETELNAGNIDLIWNGYSITDERKEKVNFSDPYLANAQIVITLSDSEIMNLSDMEGKSVATQAESSSLDAARAQAGLVESFKDAKLIEYATFNEVFNDLESGRADAIIADEVLARYYMANKGAEAYKVLEENLGPEQFGIGVRKDDEELLTELNDALKAMKDDGKYDEFYSKWFAK